MAVDFQRLLVLPAALGFFLLLWYWESSATEQIITEAAAHPRPLSQIALAESLAEEEAVVAAQQQAAEAQELVESLRGEGPADSAEEPAAAEAKGEDAQPGAAAPEEAAPPSSGDPWAELGHTVAMHVSVVVDDSPNLAKVPMLLTLYKACFSELYVVIDIPHGGCNYGPVRLSGGPATWAAFFRSKAKDDLVQETEEMLARAREMHDQHCLRPLTTRVEVIDYEAQENFDLWREAFNLSFEPVTASQGRWPWAFMWKNTMNYLIGVMRATSDFVFHADDDWGIISDENIGIAKFLSGSISELQRDPKVVFTQLTECSKESANGLAKSKVEDGITIKRSAAAGGGANRLTAGSYVSVQFYLTSKERLRSMFPLPHWRHFTESVFQLGLSNKKLLSSFLEVPGLCKVDYNVGLKKTPLTDLERKEGAYTIKKFTSNARPEQFLLSEPHGKCKFR